MAVRRSTHRSPGQPLFDILRNETVVAGLGATFLSGLDGDLCIPKMMAGATASWAAEGSAANKSMPTFSNINKSPRIV